MKLRDLGETGVIQRIRQRFQVPPGMLGIGDDAAILDLPAGHSLVFCSDLVAEGHHFLRDVHPADAIGYKAVAVNASDVGAMGGTPLHFLVSIALPGDLPVEWVDGFYDGVSRACRDFGVSLAGGDTSSGGAIFVDVSMVGSVRTGAAITRGGARPGDGIYVTGTLGESALGLEMLRSGKRSEAAVQRHLYPQPRHKVGAAMIGTAHAMIDVSDGFSTDLHHILEESRVSARVDKGKLPRAEGATDAQVLHGGEDYELIIIAQSLPSVIEQIPLTRVGEIVPMGSQPELLLDGKVLPAGGFAHFSRKDAKPPS